MTTAADDRALERAFEASLRGRSAQGEAGLAAFTGAVRGSAAQPGRPNAALAELLSTGLLIDQTSPSTRTAPAAGPPARTRTRRRTPVILTALIAKLLSAGAVAQAAAGAGVVVVVVAGAGTAGVLPGDAQTTFSSLTGSEQTLDRDEDEDETGDEAAGGASEDSVTPTGPDAILGEPDAAPGEGDEDDETGGGEGADQPLTAQELWAQNGPQGQSFGEWVAEGAENGWIEGSVVRDWADRRDDARRAEEKTDKATEKAARKAAKEAAKESAKQARATRAEDDDRSDAEDGDDAEETEQTEAPESTEAPAAPAQTSDDDSDDDSDEDSDEDSTDDRGGDRRDGGSKDKGRSGSRG